jgi:hypothetical protein
LDCCVLSFVLLIYGANFLGILGFSKCWFNVSFGITDPVVSEYNVDLTEKEFLIAVSCFGFLALFQFSFILFF